MSSIVFCILNIAFAICAIKSVASNSLIEYNGKGEMAVKRVVPTVNNSEDFSNVLDSYLANSKKLALLLDYDGTLAPLISDPTKTEMAPITEFILRKFSQNPNVFLAVISGRGLADIKSKINLPITYGGNHGIEIENPDGSRSDYKLPKEIQDNYHLLVEELNATVAGNGSWVEDKIASLTYHYRDTPGDMHEEQIQKAIEIIEKYGFIASPAHFAIEAKPPVNWNKGEAALLILRQNFGDDWSQEVNAIFSGDDTTDEDAMRALQGIGKTFRISSDPQFKTYADFRLPVQSLIPELLKYLDTIYS